MQNSQKTIFLELSFCAQFQAEKAVFHRNAQRQLLIFSGKTNFQNLKNIFYFHPYWKEGENLSSSIGGNPWQCESSLNHIVPYDLFP